MMKTPMLRLPPPLPHPTPTPPYICLKGEKDNLKMLGFVGREERGEKGEEGREGVGKGDGFWFCLMGA